MPATRTARERARAELVQEIKDEARRQLAEVGAHGLSLRAVARALGMVSSALYRYFPSRDQLLTELIVDAYDAIGEAAEQADRPDEEPRHRWQLIWHAVRAWALKHPHEYALIYGSPIPGYQAPQDTVVPASRVVFALGRVLESAALRPASEGQGRSAALRRQTDDLAVRLESRLTGAELTRLLMAWSQLFGALNFELFGQFRGSVDPSDEFFTYTAQQMADFVGLR
ncbi:TetR/AcrR family transcriptional regulator [Amycolatopsis nigrescens]|uniref:TetR/AcrR family transcriptional regulator n=1 Tax=Amycolatopsis nigrescens TaxID=381445 RepID=UPI000366CA77|nr:TetR/AcrR family transcriptional regulator [Amycolatopsis nigrescens]